MRFFPLYLQLFRNGQRLLEKQRFQFPPSWLYIDNIEGEWGAFSDIMKRKDTAIQQQVANLQLKIVQEDKAVENRTTDLLNEWEKTKPVAVREMDSCYYYHTKRFIRFRKKKRHLYMTFIH